MIMQTRKVTSGTFDTPLTGSSGPMIFRGTARFMRTGHRVFRRFIHAGCFNKFGSTGIFLRRFCRRKNCVSDGGNGQDVPVSPMPPGGSLLLTI